MGEQLCKNLRICTIQIRDRTTHQSNIRDFCAFSQAIFRGYVRGVCFLTAFVFFCSCRSMFSWLETEPFFAHLVRRLGYKCALIEPEHSVLWLKFYVARIWRSVWLTIGNERTYLLCSTPLLVCGGNVCLRRAILIVAFLLCKVEILRRCAYIRKSRAHLTSY